MQQKKDFFLSDTDKRNLLEIARSEIEGKVLNVNTTFDPHQYSPALSAYCGAFVSLHLKGELRGCIGMFDPKIPLYKVVQQMAHAASFEDHRFSPVTKVELAFILIEISVLSPMCKINSINEIELGKHGIYIKKGFHSGTFLPQVAIETGWGIDEFLGHCARDKAGLLWNEWKTAEIFIYEAIVFSEKEYK